MAIGTMKSPHMPDLHNLPDLVTDKILQLLPTKAAFQVSFLSKNWQGVVSSWPSLNFDEDDDFDRHHLKRHSHYQLQLQHIRFIYFLKGYLDYRKKNDQKEPLDKLRLHMRMYEHQDFSTITKWLKYACQRGLKELDISLVSVDSERLVEIYPYNYFYNLPLVAIATAKSLTSLKLEFVKVLKLWQVYEGLFPSLKILSLKAVRVATGQHLYSVLCQCPSIESLSLSNCSIGNLKFYVCCSSLKYLEVKSCLLNDIRVDHAFNLESFTYLSQPYSECGKMILTNAFNLKYINISVDKYLGEFSLWGCHNTLEASIKSKRIHRFKLFYGYLNAKLSFKADQATILVGELWSQEQFSSDSTYVPRLVSFIKSFSRCKEVRLYNKKVQALTVFKNYRKMTSLPPLPVTSTLLVGIPNPPVVGSRDFIELEDSLRWIAPSAKVLIMQVDAEEDRK
ncbi:PREDICTED: putative F-box/LRR-repeat protein At5g41840 [Fragaria vesca subsp. vesca]|uniref:putative F-box/LRR-repeat protein At5g41840 n=1 Tax=Fragaria vesca subsp. vesca TaxID=101020 RepID=UPI0002C3338D|nr:PREDICTED: putative F-box/LRR-repeat protein At5g41840 [Fragaria vesca subsp. vesca]